MQGHTRKSTLSSTFHGRLRVGAEPGHQPASIRIPGRRGVRRLAVAAADLLVGATLFAVYWNLLNSMKESAR